MVVVTTNEVELVEVAGVRVIVGEQHKPWVWGFRAAVEAPIRGEPPRGAYNEGMDKARDAEVVEDSGDDVEVEARSVNGGHGLSEKL